MSLRACSAFVLIRGVLKVLVEVLKHLPLTWQWEPRLLIFNCLSQPSLKSSKFTWAGLASYVSVRQIHTASHVCLRMNYLYNVQQCILFLDTAILLISWWHLKWLMLLPASYELTLQQNWVDFRIVRIKQNSFHSCTIKSSVCFEIQMYVKIPLTGAEIPWGVLMSFGKKCFSKKNKAFKIC